MASKFRREYGTFTTEINDFIAASNECLTAVIRQSVGDLIDNANQAMAKGGRMRVHTGFLRASGQVSFTGMPTGPMRAPPDTKPNSYPYNERSITIQLAQFQPGMTIYFGWTAAYALHREVYDGFLDGALQHWNRIVAINADTLRERLSK